VPEDRKLVRVLEADPELGDLLGDDERALAQRYLVAETRTLEPGSWDPRAVYDDEPGKLGLLVVEGLLTRSIKLGNTSCAEILGEGDVLRPWQEDRGWSVAPFEARWMVLEPTELAVLDRRFAAASARWPELMASVLARSVHRSRRLAFHMALSHLTRVDVRLLAVFWYMADRWGRVGPEGVVLPVRLTHQTLAQLVGAQRPSVTTALGQLAAQGKLTRRDGSTWVLHGRPPEELSTVRELVDKGEEPAAR
jgi:CRP/FNR family transcriptional regulator, cyclic AMP receptor protein